MMGQPALIDDRARYEDERMVQAIATAKAEAIAEERVRAAK